MPPWPSVPTRDYWTIGLFPPVIVSGGPRTRSPRRRHMARVGPVYEMAVYPPRSCRRARSVHFALADPIESPAERESGLFIPRRRGPLRFTGPVQNHVELVRRRAFIAPDHEELLAVRRGLVVREAVIVQEEGGPIKKPARRSEGAVRMEIDGDHRLARNAKQLFAIPRPSGLRTTFPGDRDPVGRSGIGLYVDLSSARFIGSVGDPAFGASGAGKRAGPESRLSFVGWRDPQRRGLPIRREHQHVAAGLGVDFRVEHRPVPPHRLRKMVVGRLDRKST